MRRLFASLIFVLLVSNAGAAGDDRLSAHERELLEAQIEALIERLSHSNLDDPQKQAQSYSPPATDLAIQVASRENPVAGVSLVHLSLSVVGQPEFLLAYLQQKRLAGFTPAPPVKITRAGARDRLELSLWCLRGNRFDSRAGDQALQKLRDNLVWLEKQRNSIPAFLAIVQAVGEAETFRLDGFTWESNTLTVKARHNHPHASKTFADELRTRAKRFPRALRIILDQPKAAESPAVTDPGMDLQNIELADAVWMLSEVARLSVVLASRKPSHLSESLRGQDVRDLLGRLLPSLQISWDPNTRFVVAAEELLPAPADAGMFSKEPVTLGLRHASPGYLFAWLADISRIGLIPPPTSELEVTVLVHKQPVCRIARAAWRALGLRPEGSRKLLAILPADRPTAEGTKPNDPLVDLNAADVPADLLIQELTGSNAVRSGRSPGWEVSLRLRKVPKTRLTNLLMASRGTGTAEEGQAVDRPAGDNRPGQTLRLAAVLREGPRRRALVESRGKFTWLAEGQALDQRRIVRKIYSSRLLLRSPAGRRESVPLEPRRKPDCSGLECARRPDALGIALSRLRLAGTLVLPDGQAAVLMSPDGNSHLVKPGHPLGRRCGRVTGIRPGVLTVELGCPNSFDSKEYRMILEGRFDSESGDR